MEIPSSLYGQCTYCGEESICRVLKARKSGKDRYKVLAKCPECQKAFDILVEVPKLVKVRTIISREEESERREIELRMGQELRLKDEIMLDDVCVQITGIEVDDRGGTKRVKKAPPEEIKTLWTRYFDEIVLKVSINMGQKTLADAIVTEPDDEFTVGEDVEIGRRSLYIYKIKTEAKMLQKTGASAEARDIVRIYCKHASAK